MLYVFELMLCYWAWLKRDTYWSPGDKNAREAAEAAIDTMISELVKFWPRADGNGWHITKVHEQQHVLQDIVHFGRH